MSASNLRAVLAADPELGAGNVLLRLAEHGADMDMPRVTFDTGVDAIPAWTPLSLRTLTERVAARAEWFARHGIGRRDPVAVYVTSAADVFLNFLALTWLGAIPALMNGSMPAEIAAEYIRRLRSRRGAHRRRPRRAGRATTSARRSSATRPRPAPATRPVRPRTTGTTPTIRWPSRTRPARRGCRPRSCTPTRACSRPCGRSG